MPDADLTQANEMTPTADATLFNSNDNSPRIYSAPRRFDILTILVVSTVYGAAFAILTAVHAPMFVMLVLIGFATSIGLAQALLWKGNYPRAASMLVGAAAFPICAMNWELAGVLSYWVFATLVYGTTGTIVGYIVGAFIGGLFLVIEGIRDSLFLSREPSPRTEPSSPYDD
ncbi:MAG: hypothetical protein AB8B55_08585 [Mariniblastus sp.]